MLDASVSPPVFQRIDGAARAHIGPGGRIMGLRQMGAAKVMLPKMHGRAAEVVFLNTAGGITAGDRLSYRLDVAADAQAVGTTQTAERAYRAQNGIGTVATTLSVGAGGLLHWLPQEFILFDGAGIDRTVKAEMALDAELVILESLILGRAAMGERLHRLHLRDRREVWRGGMPVMVEPLRITDADLTAEGSAGLDGAIALASLSVFAPDAEDRLQAVRAVLPVDGPVRAAASAWDGRVTARFMSGQAYPLRRAVAQAVKTITRGPLPRVWQI